MIETRRRRTNALARATGRMMLAGLAVAPLAAMASCAEPVGDGAATALVSAAESSPTTASLAAVEWTQWRGPGRDGRVGTPLPGTLPDTLTRGWSVEVGLGHSSPIVDDDRVYVFTRNGDNEVVRALSRADGQTLWQQSYLAPYKMNPSAEREHGPGPKSTPLLHGGAIYTVGIGGFLSATGVNGESVWRHEFAGQYSPQEPVFGAAMSAIAVGDTVVAHVGGDYDGTLAAFDAVSGAIRWRLDGDGPGYASPIMVDLAGTSLLVTQTDSAIVGVSPTTGELLWRMPFKTEFDQNVITPLLAGDRLILSGLDHGVFAVDLRREGDTQAMVSHEVWRNQEVSLYMSSPVLVGDRLFGMSHRRSGQFFALDVATGETIWTSVGREGDNAAILANDDHVLFLTDGAELIVQPVAGDEFAPVARYEVANTSTWAHPVLLPEGVLIKDLEHLTLWRFR